MAYHSMRWRQAVRSKVEYPGQGPLPEFLQPAWGDPTFLRAGGMGLLLARETDLDRRWTVGQKFLTVRRR